MFWDILLALFCFFVVLPIVGALICAAIGIE